MQHYTLLALSIPGQNKVDVYKLRLFKDLLKQIESSLGYVLLIFDNVEIMKDVIESLDIRSIICKTGITTRNENMIPDYAYRIDMAPFGEKEVTEYVIKKLKFA